MPRIILDWDPGRKQAIIVSDFLENIRAQFSIPNKSKSIMTKKGKPTWYMADFISPITKTGRFDIGLYFEIVHHLKSNKDLDYEITTTEPLQTQLIQTYPWNSSYTIPTLSLPLRPYQESGVKRAIHMGYGVLIVGTAGGKTLIMASLVQTIRNRQAGLTSLIILPSNLVKQTYKEFLGYDLPKEDLSIWNGDEEFTKAPIILASAEILKSNLITFAERSPTPEYKWKPEAEETYKDYVDACGKKEKARKIIWTARRKKILGELSDVDLILIDECLRAGHTIKTDKGTSLIENIKEGDLVLSHNLEKKIDEYKPVTKLYRNLYESNMCDTFIEITLVNDQTIQVTPNHKIYTNRGMIRADEITVEDEIITIA